MLLLAASLLLTRSLDRPSLKQSCIFSIHFTSTFKVGNSWLIELSMIYTQPSNPLSHSFSFYLFNEAAADLLLLVLSFVNLPPFHIHIFIVFTAIYNIYFLLLLKSFIESELGIQLFLKCLTVYCLFFIYFVFIMFSLHCYCCCLTVCAQLYFKAVGYSALHNNASKTSRKILFFIFVFVCCSPPICCCVGHFEG